MIAIWFCFVMHYELKKQDYESFYRGSGESSYKSLKIIFFIGKKSKVWRFFLIQYFNPTSQMHPVEFNIKIHIFDKQLSQFNLRRSFMLHWCVKCCCTLQEFIFDKPNSWLLASD